MSHYKDYIVFLRIKRHFVQTLWAILSAIVKADLTLKATRRFAAVTIHSILLSSVGTGREARGRCRIRHLRMLQSHSIRPTLQFLLVWRYTLVWSERKMNFEK